LFAALSAEAYINRYLVERFKAADFAALERLSTADKFVVGPRLVSRRRFSTAAMSRCSRSRP